MDPGWTGKNGSLDPKMKASDLTQGKEKSKVKRIRRVLHIT